MIQLEKISKGTVNFHHHLTYSRCIHRVVSQNPMLFAVNLQPDMASEKSRRAVNGFIQGLCLVVSCLVICSNVKLFYTLKGGQRLGNTKGVKPRAKKAETKMLHC